MPSPLAALHAAAAACASDLQESAPSFTDDELIDLQREIAAISRLVDAGAGALAAQVAHRSRRELGYDGLAQKRGMRTPEALVQHVTGTSSGTARRLVRVGTLVATRLQAAPSEPWLAPVLESAAQGLLCAEAVEAIRAGLGAPCDSVTVSSLLAAAGELARLAPTATVDRLAARARELRDELDAAGVVGREAELRSRRYLRLLPQLDGMMRLVGLLDPESAAIVASVVDAATSPRRGGPRFVDPQSAAAADALVADDRTTEQIALDALVDVVDATARADSTRIGSRRTDVRVVVTQADLDRREGAAHIEGQTASVSIATVERLACDGGLIPVLFDGAGAVLDLGRTRRLHSSAQRVAIATRDGGCLAPECDRPPAWSEVHHIHEFSRGGVTSVDDGVLLCRHHHMLVHNNGWKVERERHRYVLIPPRAVDPSQTRIELPSKSLAVRRALATA